MNTGVYIFLMQNITIGDKRLLGKPARWVNMFSRHKKGLKQKPMYVCNSEQRFLKEVFML